MCVCARAFFTVKLVRDFLDAPMNQKVLGTCVNKLSPGARMVIKNCLSKLPAQEVRSRNLHSKPPVDLGQSTCRVYTC
jgi:hypothetical protein